jgi:hypothetical protein
VRRPPYPDFDKFHVMRHLGEALDAVRKSEYGRLAGRDRRYIINQSISNCTFFLTRRIPCDSDAA